MATPLPLPSIYGAQGIVELYKTEYRAIKRGRGGRASTKKI